jgi:predicted component of type VI protein secretion system
MVAEETLAVALAERLLSEAEKLRAQFQSEGNTVRAGHMQVLSAAAARLKTAAVAGTRVPASARACQAVLEIQRLGYPEAENFEESEKRVLPLLAIYEELKRHASAT